MKKKILSITLTLTLCIGLFIPARAVAAPSATTSSQFTDVPEGAWYAETLQTAVEHGWLSGYGDGRFGPEDVVNSDQVAQVIYNIAPEVLRSSYRDQQAYSDGYWAYSVSQWIVNEKIMEKYVGPDWTTISFEEYANLYKAGFARVCRRDECVSAFARLERGYGFLDPGYYEAQALSIPDLADAKYKEELKLAYFNGLVHGTGDGYFHPADTLTRAELAQILVNFMDLIEGKEYNKESAKPIFDKTKEKYIGWDHTFDYNTPEYTEDRPNLYPYFGEYEGWTYCDWLQGYVKNESLGGNGEKHELTVEEYLILHPNPFK